MSRDRDPFERTLDLLRRGLRAGDHGFGQPLNIKKLAAGMKVSSTAVREALARLSGEGLIERAQSGYLTRRYDLCGLRELYRLDQVYALAASIRTGQGAAPVRPIVEGFDEPSMDDHVARTELLLAALSAPDPTLAAARQSVWDRLAPFRAAEPAVLAQVEAEVVSLRAAGRSADPLHAVIRVYYRRRLKAAGAILGAALGRKYQSNIP